MQFYKKILAVVFLLLLCGNGCSTLQTSDSFDSNVSSSTGIQTETSAENGTIDLQPNTSNNLENHEAPNGTYQNVNNETVPSPYSAPSAPSGATARCGDGTYSFSQHRSGTCSHHGGVKEWL